MTAKRHAEQDFLDRVTPHLAAVQRFLARRIGREHAPDLLQDVCVVAWRKRREMPYGDATLLWLYKVAGNVARNFSRTSSRRAAIVLRYLPFLAPPVQDPWPLSGITDERLAAALAALSANDREVLRLWAWEELDYREIALVLDLSETAAATRLSRAKQRLTDAYQSDSR